MSTLTIPNSFTAGTTALSASVNANFTAIATWANGNVDSTNIGSFGIYASQIIPTSVATATFGGTQNYTFPASLVLANTTATAISSAATGSTAGLSLNSTNGTITVATPIVNFQLSGVTKALVAVDGGFAPGAGTGTGPGTAKYYSGSGAPTFSAPNGSLYTRYDSTTVLYVNTSGASSSGTTWTAVTVP